MTAIALFLAYHINWIRERHALIARHTAQANEIGQRIPIAIISPSPRDGPGLLWLFGERNVQQFTLVGPYERADATQKFVLTCGILPHPDHELVRHLFPEIPENGILVLGTLGTTKQ